MYEKWAESCDLAGIQHLRKDSWERWTQKIGVIVSKELLASERKWRAKCAINKEMSIAIDCRWSSRGHNAEEGTVLACCPKECKVIAHSHLMRKQENSSGIKIKIKIHINNFNYK